MRKPVSTAVTIATILFFSLTTIVSGQSRKTFPGSEYAPGEVLVKFRPGTVWWEEAGIRGRVRGLMLRKFGRINVQRLKVSGLSVEQAILKLREDPRVEFAEPNWRVIPLGRRIPNDASFGLMWHLDDSSGYAITVGGASYSVDVDIDAPEAWAVLDSAYWSTMRSAVGVLDSGTGQAGFFSNTSGYVPNHEDLSSTLLFINSGETIDGTDSDLNGLIDDINGWDWEESDNIPADSTPTDDAHGTFISGIIASTWDNGTGTSGAGKNLVEILPLRASFVSDLVAAIGYAADLADAGGEVRVLNASWKLPSGPSSALESAISNAGTSGLLFVAAAGNDGTDNDAAPVYPASYSQTQSNVLAVSATGPTGYLASFSNYGVNSVQLAAPGDSMVSTWTGTNGYGVGGGTSFSAPVAATGAALIMAGNPSMTPEDAISRLEFGGDFDERLLDRVATSRRVNLAGTLAPFYPYSGWSYLDSITTIELYSDPTSASYGSITGGQSADNTVAVLAGDQVNGWFVSPVGPGIADFTLYFGSGSAPVVSYQTGPWRVTAIRPFSGDLEVNQYIDFDPVGTVVGTLSWSVEDINGTGVGTVSAESGFFVAKTPGRARVVLLNNGIPYDHSGPIRVVSTTNQPPAVLITSGPTGTVQTDTVTFTWSGTDSDGTVSGYFASIDESTPTIFTTATSRAFTGLGLGGHTFYLRAADNQGALSQVVSRSFTISQEKKSRRDNTNEKCFIATVVAGTSLASALPAMREFRDDYLKTNAFGRAIVRAYYWVSPSAADFIRRHEGWRRVARIVLVPVMLIVEQIN